MHRRTYGAESGTESVTESVTVSVSVSVTEAESVTVTESVSRKGSRLARWQDAMGSANETRSALQVAEAVGLARPSAGLMDRLDKIVATLWKLTR